MFCSTSTASWRSFQTCSIYLKIGKRKLRITAGHYADTTVMQQRKQGRVDINQTNILGISEKKQLQETWNGICFQCLKKKKSTVLNNYIHP